MTSATLRSDSYQKREKALEEKYFNEQDRELLQKLMKKMNLSHDPTGENSVESLRMIFDKHKIKMDPSLEQDLLSWKRLHETK